MASRLPSAAALDRTLDIQSASASQDAYGEPIETWSTTLAAVPCEYVPLSGAERLQADQLLATKRAQFRIRHRTDLTRVMRLVFESETWEIRDLEEDRRYPRRAMLLITAELIAAT